jgi:hypothetical protein
MTIQQLFDSTKEFILKDKSNENWTVYSMNIPKELHMIIILLKKKEKEQFDKLCKEFTSSK